VLVVSCGCYINIAGRKPISRESASITKIHNQLALVLDCADFIGRSIKHVGHDFE
jgi:hypothetical protein